MQRLDWCASTHHKEMTVDIWGGGILSHNLKIRAHATRGFWSCQSVCQCIPLSRKHHVPECQVLPTKHNSSVALSGCHFTKPGRLGEITSICGKTNGRLERTAWDMTSTPGCARKRRSIVFGRPSKPLQPSCCHLRPSLCFYLVSPWTSIQPPTPTHNLRHAAIVRVWATCLTAKIVMQYNYDLRESAVWSYSWRNISWCCHTEFFREENECRRKKLSGICSQRRSDKNNVYKRYAVVR